MERSTAAGGGDRRGGILGRRQVAAGVVENKDKRVFSARYKD